MALDLYGTPANLEQDKEFRIVLKVNGRVFNFWKSINVNRSIAQIAGTFTFIASNRYAGEDEKWGFTTGDECQVFVDGQEIITGYIDEIEKDYNDISVSGRDKTGDLVDCPYDVFTYISELKNQTFLQIIQKLTEPFRIDTILDSALIFESSFYTSIAEYKIETGALVFEQIAILCQQYGVLPVPDGKGNLKITRAGLSKASDILQVGVNIKNNKLTQSDKDRFSVYYAEGPAKSNAFSDNLIAEGKLVDNYVKRHRPYIILVGEQATNETCQKRVAWEARIRAGASRKVSTQVRGWTQSNGKIWPLNGLVQVLDDKIGVIDELLIASLNLKLDDSGGEITNLALVHPDTFVLKQNTPVNSTEGINAFGRPLKNSPLKPKVKKPKPYNPK